MAIRSARAPSPAFSETEVDISSKLFGDDAISSDDEGNANTEPLGTSQKARKKARRDDGNAAGMSDDDEDDAFISMLQSTANRSKSDNKSGKKAGAFQTMGLNGNLLKAISRKGFNVPTPIQRKTIPLILDGQDVVGMARTGSGKTAAFVIPMIEKLKSHSAKVGARAVVLSPSRELALQTLKVVKEMGKGTDLRTTLLVGGDSLEEQFSSMASNPDIIIATPGRFEHLKVEMRLELSSVKYIVFDEADRLFEMGFAAQLMEIMHSLPPSRQTLLFSATLPKSLVEFARAGLQDPRLVRLDAESKIAPGLESAFFNVKRAEKEGALLHVLQDVIKMPTGRTKADLDAQNEKPSSKKRKRGLDDTAGRFGPSPHSTVIFAATKHHVEYLAGFLKAVGYATSYVYGALDQTARKMQVQDFRTGMTNILVVTDVAARGLDIPILANVINYDFPSQPKIFIHRVGRTARAGKQGWSYSFVTGTDMPYLLDLQLFLSRKLVVGRNADKEPGLFQNCIVFGAMARSSLERYMEEAAKLIDEDIDLSSMRDVAAKGEKQYIRSRNAASAESVKRAKQLVQTEDMAALNLIFEPADGVNVEQARLDMLARVSGFRPQETIFEIGRRGTTSEAVEIMKKRRAQLEAKQRKAQSLADGEEEDDEEADATVPAVRGHAAADEDDSDDSDEELVLTGGPGADMDAASDDELELTFTAPGDTSRAGAGGGKQKWQDSEHFMSYTPTTLNMAEDRGYGVHSGGTGTGTHFVTEARGATMDLTNDDADKRQGGGGLRWDKKQKKYVARANDEDGSKGAKMIRGESGLKIAASFRSGRFDAWKKANRVERLPKVGEMERAGAAGRFGAEGGKRYKHKQEKAPKEADKYRDDYEVRKKKVAEAKEKRIGRFRDGAGKSELRGVDDVRKERRLTQNRRDKNGRAPRRRQ